MRCMNTCLYMKTAPAMEPGTSTDTICRWPRKWRCGHRPPRSCRRCRKPTLPKARSEEHTSELQSLMRISYAVFCLKKNKNHNNTHLITDQNPHTNQHTQYTT